MNLNTIYCLIFIAVFFTPFSIPPTLQLHNYSASYSVKLFTSSPSFLPPFPSVCLFSDLLHHPSSVYSVSHSCRSSWPGLCDSGLPPALLPKYHLRRHRQRGHLRPGGGIVSSGAPSPEEAKRPVAQKCKRDLTSPPPSSAPAAVTSGHLGPGPCPSWKSRSISKFPHHCRPVQLNTSGSAAAVWDPVSVRTTHGLTSIIFTSCSGCQVKRIIQIVF